MKNNHEREDFLNELAELCKCYHVGLDFDFEELESCDPPTFYGPVDESGFRWYIDLKDIYREINET